MPINWSSLGTFRPLLAANVLLLIFGTTVVAQTVALDQSAGRAGKQLTITVTGTETHFDKNTTVVAFDAGITAAKPAVASATQLNVAITIAADAIPGPRKVTVTTGPEVAALEGGFVVQAPPAIK